MSVHYHAYLIQPPINGLNTLHNNIYTSIKTIEEWSRDGSAKEYTVKDDQKVIPTSLHYNIVVEFSNVVIQYNNDRVC